MLIERTLKFAPASSSEKGPKSVVMSEKSAITSHDHHPPASWDCILLYAKVEQRPEYDHALLKSQFPVMFHSFPFDSPLSATFPRNPYSLP